MEILRCEGVRKVYGPRENPVVALDRIDLSVTRIVAMSFCEPRS